MTSVLFLREVADADLSHFFDHQRDARAIHMAAFTAENPDDKAAFLSHWRLIRSDASVLIRTIAQGSDVLGHIASFEDEGRREITYWVAAFAWRRGYATEALRIFLGLQETRPLHARVASDNVASFRILEKHGFQPISETVSYAHGRKGATAETLLELY